MITIAANVNYNEQHELYQLSINKLTNIIMDSDCKYWSGINSIGSSKKE